MLGLDEAGRGSLLGPLVVGGFRCPADRIGELSDWGVRDSKLLSPSRREEVYRRLRREGLCLSAVVSPRTVDRFVLRHGLNELEARTFAHLIRRAEDPGEVFVDACDVDAGRFGERVRCLAGRAPPVDARHKADRDNPVVGAASIVAKVVRDAAIRRLETDLGEAIGSGYPSDPITVEFVRSFLGRGGPMPAWLRASWATTRRLIQRRTQPPLEAFGP